MSKIIFHLDLDAFFASVEIACNTSYANKPLIIGGRTSNSVVSTCNYEARKYGVRSAMPIFQAKKICPQAIYLNGNYELYEDYSQRFFNLLKKDFSNILEELSIDECFLDVTKIVQSRYNNDYLKLAYDIQKIVKSKLKITVSIGISSNKFLAKMASDMKKPNGITILFKEQINEKLWPLPIEKMYFVGEKTAPIFKKLKINTIGDLANYNDMNVLEDTFSKTWYDLWLNANGEGDDFVDISKNLPKSLSVHQTLLQKTNDINEIETVLKYLCEDISKKMDSYDAVAKSIFIIYKYYDSDKYHTNSITLSNCISDNETIYHYAKKLFVDNFNDNMIKLVGVGVKNLSFLNQTHQQSTIFDKPIKNTNQKNKKLEKIVEEVNKKIGKNILSIGFKQN